jgi:DNA-binding GntR family transcriptional regulator
MEARLVLEQFAAGKAIGRGATACAAVFERLSVELARQRDAAAATDWRAFVEADRAFHAITLQESGNAILSGFYASLRDRQMRMIGESALREPDRVATILAEHRGIGEALRDGDLPRALQAVQTHLAGTVRAMRLSVF